MTDLTRTLCVLIATHNRLDLLVRTLRSIAQCDRPTAWDVRILVVENGGRFGCESVVSSMKEPYEIRYLYHELGNKSAALNFVLEQLDGDTFIVFLDDDVTVSRSLLVSYAMAAESYPEHAFFGGETTVEYEEHPPKWLIRYLPFSARGWRPRRTEDPCHDGFFLGFNWAAYARDLADSGGFDPAVGPGGESGGTGQESNMQQRLLDRGLDARFVENASVRHYVPASRCTTDWVLDRTRRNALSAGLNARRAQDHAIFRAFMNIVIALALPLIGWGRALFLANDMAERRFLLKRSNIQFKGRIQGMWLHKTRND